MSVRVLNFVYNFLNTKFSNFHEQMFKNFKSTNYASWPAISHTHFQPDICQTGSNVRLQKGKEQGNSVS